MFRVSIRPLEINFGLVWILDHGCISQNYRMSKQIVDPLPTMVPTINLSLNDFEKHKMSDSSKTIYTSTLLKVDKLKYHY